MIRKKLTRAMAVYLMVWTTCWLVLMGTVQLSAQAILYGTNAKLTGEDILWQQRHSIGVDGSGPRKRFEGGSGSLRGIAVDARGSVYATGYSFGGANFDCITWKFDREGKLLWKRSYDGGGNDAGNGISIDANGNLYVAGFTSNGTNDDFLILKYDAAGTLLWRKTFDSSGEDRAYGVAADAKANVYVTGRCWSKTQEWVRRTSEVNAGCGPPGRCTKGEDWVTLKYDSAGKVSWQRSVVGFGVAVASGGEGHVYAVGDEGGAIQTYDPSGRLLWQKKSQLLDPDWGWGGTLAVATDAQDSVYVAGNVSSRATNDLDAFLVKYRPDGNLAWKRTYHDVANDSAYAVAVDGQRRAYLIIDRCLVKCDSEGRPVWSKQLDWDASALACDAEGSVYVGGVWGSTDERRRDLVIVKLRKR